jgi:hypothetical protein
MEGKYLLQGDKRLAVSYQQSAISMGGNFGAFLL